jgi:hypothetical protein
VLAGLALAAACTRDLPQRSDGGQPDCTGLAVPTIGCLVGTAMLVCVLDGNGHPEWSVTCSGGNTGGSGGVGGGGGTGGTGGSNPTPSPVTFALENGGATSVFIFESCSPDLTITELSNPTVTIGRPVGCGICDCAQATCPPVTCGACFEGGQEIPAAGAQQYVWDPVDISYQTRGTTQCSNTRILPPGHYRIDVPVYTTSANAAARTGGWVASQTFDLPATDTVVVQLASGAP